jgi:hypothetical protein
MAQQQHLGWQWQQHWGLRLPEMQLCFSLTGKVSGYRTSKRTNWPEDCDGAGMQKSAAEEGNAAADAGVKTWLKSASTMYHDLWLSNETVRSAFTWSTSAVHMTDTSAVTL